ncbi:dihydrofolate synthase/folylpolyglutamate synthase [Fluviicoccus keumensis]|uniref:Dihydrofolate synthase/folylpolyglutamate synthase n=1 Tax=Fluviicoccus keumensis TaxID=1435465 RepID=A0A4Q7Z8P7_9GAMM|nr:bifunctional tetrahydrofolate synthase/dihydrofolate synthase [Fluviicoccus keumensis]RZU46882.1 dihydrofolate synthase/folylpolyglutamate synthase [Fluviicoccus keumensis]
MFSTLSEWLAHLELAHVRAIDLGLDRVRQVARVLDADHFACPVITVGGTNGKGSTVATLTSVYLAAGYRVATYTSPHLYVFNERIALDGSPVADDVLIGAFEAVEAARVQADVSLSYFEFTTLAAFVVFREANPDIVVLEVGLGGRLDAVNLVDATVAVITSIGIDHTDWLGDTREAIGFEKAGIFRAGHAVVCGDREPPATLLDHAADLECPMALKGRDFDFAAKGASWSWWSATARHDGLLMPRLALDNVATALAAIQAVSLPVSESALREGIVQASVPGRLERLLWQGVEIVLDVAHNPHGAAFFMQQLQPVRGRTRAVLAMLADKDAGGVLDACLGRVDVWYPAGLQVSRGQDAQRLLSLLQERGMYFAAGYARVAAALAAALHEALPGDRILVFGSFYTVSAAREWLEKNHGYSN